LFEMQNPATFGLGLPIALFLGFFWAGRTGSGMAGLALFFSVLLIFAGLRPLLENHGLIPQPFVLPSLSPAPPPGAETPTDTSPPAPLLAPAVGTPHASSQTEPETGHKYAAAITAYGGGTGRSAQNLVGVGVRKKKVMGSAIKLYTVGLYVDSAGAKAALGSADGTAAALENLMGASVAQTLRIVFESRLINAQRLNESFDDALLKDMQAAGEAENFRQLKAGFGKIDLKPGVEILISITKDGAISVEEPGKGATATVESRKLCQGMLSVYLGPSAVSPEAKASMAAGLPAALALAQAGGDAGTEGTAPAPPPASAPAGKATTNPAAPAAASAPLTPEGPGRFNIQGTWEVCEFSGVMDLMQSLGLSMLVRQVAKSRYEKDVKVIEVDGSSVSLTDFRGFKKNADPVAYSPGVTRVRLDKMGTELTEVGTWSPAGEWVVETQGYRGGKFGPMVTTFGLLHSPDKLVSVTTFNGASMRRVWRQCAGHAAGGAGLYLPPHQNAQAPPAEPPQGASRRAPSVKVAPSDISGNWAVCEATNVTEFLTTFGIPEVALKVGRRVYEQDKKVIEQMGAQVSLVDFRGRHRGTRHDFTPGEVYPRQDEDGFEWQERAHWTVHGAEGSAWVVHTAREGQESQCTQYYRSGDFLITETVFKGTRMTRKWARA
jgi:hypothetical protein